MHYYRRELAFIHDRGYGLHADRCAPGILELLSGDGLVLASGRAPPRRLSDTAPPMGGVLARNPDETVR